MEQFSHHLTFTSFFFLNRIPFDRMTFIFQFFLCVFLQLGFIIALGRFVLLLEVHLAIAIEYEKLSSSRYILGIF